MTRSTVMLVPLNQWCGSMQILVLTKGPIDHPVCRGTVSPGMLNNTRAVQTHFTIMLQIFWLGMTLRGIWHPFNINSKWQTWLHARTWETTGNNCLHVSSLFFFSILSNNSDQCFTIQHGNICPTPAILMCRCTECLNHMSTFATRSFSPGFVQCIIYTKCKCTGWHESNQVNLAKSALKHPVCNAKWL